MFGDKFIRSVFIGNEKGKNALMFKNEVVGGTFMNMTTLEDYDNTIKEQMKDIKNPKDLFKSIRKDRSTVGPDKVKVYDKLNMIHKYIYSFLNLNGIENKLLLSQSVMKLLIDKNEKNVMRYETLIPLKTIATNLVKYFNYKSHYVEVLNETPIKPKFTSSFKKYELKPDNINNYILDLFSVRYDGDDLLEELDVLEKIEGNKNSSDYGDNLFKAFHIINMLQNKVQFTSSDSKENDITNIVKNDIYKLNSNMVSLIYSISRCYDIEEVKDYHKARTIINYDTNIEVPESFLLNQNYYEHGEHVIELPNTVTNGSKVNFLQGMSILSLMRNIPRKINENESVWKNASDTYQIPNFDNIKFLQRKETTFIRDVFTSILGIDNLKDMTNIANIGNTLRRYKYTNLERLRGISPFSDDFYIKRKGYQSNNQR